MEVDETSDTSSIIDQDEEFDRSAYIVYKKFETHFPCLSFDVIQDKLGEKRADLYPLTSYLACGTSEADSIHNSLLVVKIGNVYPIEDAEDELEEEDSDDDDDQKPTISVAKIAHNGCINRVRVNTILDHPVAATWSETGKVHLWDLQRHMKAVDEGHSGEEKIKPLFTFSGHEQEGFGLDWSTTIPGRLATGGNDSRIYVWNVTESGWTVNPQPFTGHRAAIEDIQWSPNEPNVLTTCSSDGTVKVWDVRNAQKPPALDFTAHNTDVNVISWNKIHSQYLISGADDGIVRVWDFRNIKDGKPTIEITYHQKAITSLEWHPTDESAFAVASEDNKVTHWDLSLESEEANDDDCPEYLLFEHGGQSEIKEIHWHPQMPDVVVTTAMDSFNLYRANNSPDIGRSSDDDDDINDEQSE